ncbi:MAG: hypothetical protein KDB27_05180 [Planctomycetales bacterium]|nr:hypothetical protein [Planctomycetales bacterium]
MDIPASVQSVKISDNRFVADLPTSTDCSVVGPLDNYQFREVWVRRLDDSIDRADTQKERFQEIVQFIDRCIDSSLYIYSWPTLYVAVLYARETDEAFCIEDGPWKSSAQSS